MIDQEFVNVFVAANKRLKQPLAIESIFGAVEYLASQPINTCLSIQPGSSGYAWSERKVVMVFLWNKKGHVRGRFIKRTSFRNAELTPSSFKELRAFPKGKLIEKLELWDKVDDGITVSKKQLNTKSELPKNFYSEDDEIIKEVFFRKWLINDIDK